MALKITHDLPTALWCGLAAISAATGEPTSKALALAKHFSKRTVVKGMTNWTLVSVLNALGYRAEKIHDSIADFVECRRQPTLAGWTKSNAKTFSSHPVIINVTGHYVTVQGKSFVDTFTPGFKPVRLKKAPWRRSRVCRAWKIVKVEGPQLQVVPVKKPADGNLAKARRIAKRIGITLEAHSFPGEYWVYPPDGFDCARDPFESEGHLGYDAADVLHRVTEYARILDGGAAK